MDGELIGAYNQFIDWKNHHSKVSKTALMCGRLFTPNIVVPGSYEFNQLQYKINLSEFFRPNIQSECYRDIFCIYRKYLEILPKHEVPLEDADYIMISHPTARTKNWIPNVVEQIISASQKRKPGAKIIVVEKACNAEKYINDQIKNGIIKPIENIEYYPSNSVEKLAEMFNKPKVKEEHIVYDDYNKQLNIWPVNGCKMECGFCRRCFLDKNNPPFKVDKFEDIKSNLEWYKNNDKAKLRKVSLRAENLTEYSDGDKGLNDIIDLLNSCDEIEEIELPIGLAIPELNDKVLDSLCRCKKIKYIQIDIEAGTDRLLEKIDRKNSSVTRMEKIFKRLKDENPGIYIVSNVLIGLPTETEEDIKETVALIRRIKPNYVIVKTYDCTEGQKLAKEKQLEKEVVRSHRKLFYNQLGSKGFEEEFQVQIEEFDEDRKEVKEKLEMIEKEKEKTFDVLFLPRYILFFPNRKLSGNKGERDIAENIAGNTYYIRTIFTFDNEGKITGKEGYQIINNDNFYYYKALNYGKPNQGTLCYNSYDNSIKYKGKSFTQNSSLKIELLKRNAKNISHQFVGNVKESATER